MLSKLLLCVMLCCTVLPVAAREAAMTPAGGSCSVTQEESGDGEAARGTPDKRTGEPAPGTRTPARRVGDGEASARPPRWHSFLPGMFR